MSKDVVTTSSIGRRADETCGTATVLSSWRVIRVLPTDYSEAFTTFLSSQTISTPKPGTVTLLYHHW